VVNFVDARTRWFDEAVKQALRSSIKQVRGHTYTWGWRLSLAGQHQ
jgi:hypothetical protein